MADIATLMMKIEADTKDFEKKMGGVGNTMKTIGKGMAVAGVAIAGTTAALYKVATQSAETGDRVDKMSHKIGLSREAFQELDYVFGQSGANIDQLQMGMKTMVAAMEQAATGAGNGAKNFDMLGISVKDTEGNLKNQETVLYETLAALQKMPEGAEKARLANELFGRSGSELMPLLNDEAGSIEELTAQAHELGLVMSDEAVDASVLFGDTMDAIKKSLGMVVTDLGIAVMPMFQKFMDWVLENLPKIKEIFGDVFGVIKDVVMKVWETFELYVLPVLQAMFGWIEKNFPVMKETFLRVFNAIKRVLDVVWELIELTVIPIFEALFGKIGESDGVASGFDKAFGIINGVINGAITVIETLIGWLEKAVEWYKKLKEAMSGNEGSTGTFTGSANRGSKTKDTETAEDKIAIANISSKKGVDLSTARAMYKWGGALADGGIVDKPTIALIGEAGREAVIPLDKGGVGNNITINVRSPFDVAKEIDFIQKKLAWGI